MSIFGDLVSSLGGADDGNGGTFNTVLQFVQQQPGGIQGVIEQLREGGMGSVVDSWISTGFNQSITPEQIQSALGSQTVQNIADRLGIDPSTLSSTLSQSLPALIDQISPNGQLPESGDLLSQGMDFLKSRL